MHTHRFRHASLATLIAASTFAVACVDVESDEHLDAQSVVEDEFDFSVDRVDFEAGERGVVVDALEVVDNRDGTWSHAPPEGFDPELRLRGGIVTWRYAGQARYSNQPTRGGTRTWIANDAPLLSPREQLMAMTRVDRLGRVWKVEAVDDEAWALARAPATDEFAANSLDFDTIDVARNRTLEVASGTPVAWQPMSWNHEDCIPGGWPTPNEGHFWDGDNRDIINSGHTARQKTAVKIKVNGSITCSGVILRGDQVLTAAHCVSDDNNNPIPVSTVGVFRDDISAWRDASDIDFSPSYGGGSGSGGGTDFADDWAIIELETPWSDAYEDMDLSSASNSTLSALTNVHNLAFPGFAPECDPISSGTLVHNKENEPITGIFEKTLRFKIDGTPGHSGSPIYYCPAGDNNVCGPGDQGFVIAVFAGWNSTVDRFVGPKSAFFVDAAIAFMDD